MSIVTTNILSTICAMGLNTLRERVVMPRIVNRDYEQAITSRTRFSTVNVAVPAAVATRTVSPAVVPPSVSSVTPTNVAVTLTEWKEAPFTMTDKDLSQVDHGILPMQAAEAIRSLANDIDVFLFGKYVKFYGYAGTAGTTPFADDLSAYLTARKLGFDQLMPKDNRYMILNTDAEANALNLRAFQDASFRGDREGIIEGEIGRKLGALWLLSDNVPTHTTGAAGTPLIDLGAGYAAGVAAVHMDGFTTKPSVGDVFSIAGSSQTYTVLTASDLVGTDSDITFSPVLDQAVADDDAVTFKATHAVNLLLHRDAMAFAMAPLLETIEVPGLVNQAVVIDEESGLSLRLEVTRQHKQYQWSFDALWGASVIRPELGVRLAG